MWCVQLKEADEVHRRMKHGVYINMASMFAVQQQRNTLAAERAALEEQLSAITEQTSTHRTKLFRLEEAEFWRRSRLRSRAVQTDPQVMDGRGMQTDKSYLASFRAVEALSGVSSVSKSKAVSARVSSTPFSEPSLQTPKALASPVPTATASVSASVSTSTCSSTPASSEPSSSSVPPIAIGQTLAKVASTSKSKARSKSRPSSAAAGRETTRTVSPSGKTVAGSKNSVAASSRQSTRAAVNTASEKTSTSPTGKPASGQKTPATATSVATTRASPSRQSAAENATARAALADMLRSHLVDDDEFDLAGNQRPSTAAQRLYPVRTWTPAFGDDGFFREPSSVGMEWGRSAVPIRVESVNVLKNDPASALQLLSKLQEAQVEHQVAAASAAAMAGHSTTTGTQFALPMRPVAVDAAASGRWAVPAGHASAGTVSLGTPADFHLSAPSGRASTGTLGLMPTEPTTRPATSVRRPTTGGAVPDFVKRLIKDGSTRR